jgi:hypothetical protein
MDEGSDEFQALLYEAGTSKDEERLSHLINSFAHSSAIVKWVGAPSLRVLWRSSFKKKRNAKVSATVRQSKAKPADNIHTLNQISPVLGCRRCPQL